MKIRRDELGRLVFTPQQCRGTAAHSQRVFEADAHWAVLQGQFTSADYIKFVGSEGGGGAKQLHFMLEKRNGERVVEKTTVLTLCPSDAESVVVIRGLEALCYAVENRALKFCGVCGEGRGELAFAAWQCECGRYHSTVTELQFGCRTHFSQKSDDAPAPTDRLVAFRTTREPIAV